MSEQQLQVVVCGGGIAGAEALLRLHRLAAERIRLTLVAPDEALVNRPLAVREPFALPGLRRYPLARLAADTRASLYLTAHVIAGRGWESEISEQPPWPADEKVVAEELGPYLAGLDAETA